MTQELVQLNISSTIKLGNNLFQARLPIGFQKSCDCPPTHINCMTAKEWIKSQLGVWQFYYEGRDIRDKNLHPATFPISLADVVPLKVI